MVFITTSNVHAQFTGSNSCHLAKPVYSSNFSLINRDIVFRESNTSLLIISLRMSMDGSGLVSWLMEPFRETFSAFLMNARKD